MRAYLVSLLCGASALAIGTAQAGTLPGHGHFVSGQGSIGKGNQSLTVKQSSTTGIINWNSFSVGKHEGVTFDNGHGATLNRVTGGNLSRIAGSLHATGSLYLLNSSGVIVSGTGRIVTGGNFIASSGSLTNSAFNEDQRRFGNSAGKVINHGSITAGKEAKLVGGSVTNTGTITAAHVKLRATDGAVLAGGSLNATGDAHHNANILVISDTGETKVTGALNAHNGDGSGGLIETSGHSVSIGGNIDAGKGGTWLVDPENLYVDLDASNAIDGALNHGTDVTLKTTATGTSGPGGSVSGPGDIIIHWAISWNTNANLTLDAYHSVHFNAPITVEGLGGLVTQINDGGTGGSYRYYNNASVTFANTTSNLTMDGQQYTLIDNMDDLQAINNDSTSLSGHYALAQSIDASSMTNFWTSIGVSPDDFPNSTFSGIFDGLGNTISHFQTGPSLFGYSTGTIRDVGMLNASVNSKHYVGALVAENYGTVWWSYSTGVVFGAGHCYSCSEFGPEDQGVGGLVGLNEGLVSHSHSDATVTGSTRKPTIGIGGLVGINHGTISVSYATGSVSRGKDIGGLVGDNEGGISDSYATGQILSGAKVSAAGGLVGYNHASIVNSYASGGITGKDDVGGLVGWDSAGEIQASYSTGKVKGQHRAGGLIGLNQAVVTNSYWDTQTSGTTRSAAGQGLTTAELEAGLPKGFHKSAWGIDPSINGGLPYLKDLKNSY